MLMHYALMGKRGEESLRPETKKACILAQAFKVMVPGGGIEPPTRGFSILCSTD